MPFTIVPVVEGHGEQQAVPELLRRLIAQLDLGVPLEIRRPIRASRDKLLRGDNELQRALGLAALQTGQEGAILILLDSEGECPAEIGPALLARAQALRRDQRIFLVLAHREFEAWFLASAESLRGQRGLSHSIETHAAPESVHGCKEWLEKSMPPSQRYSETADQVAFARMFDIQLARRNAPSFDKFWREFEAICQFARSVVPGV